MNRVGVAISGGPNPAEIIDLVVLAESLGYDSAWVAEGHGGDQFAILAACAARTSRIRLGTSISSVFVRSAPTIAMAASTIADLSGGRFILGLGSSHKAQVQPEHGILYSKPLTRTRETAELAVTDDMIDATSMSGTPEQCRARIEAYRRSGIDLPIISPFARGQGAKSRFEAAIRACAPAKTG
jgi:alkanesulfonate monooxygenase SsuD/methylene tetrahydromethanopterin reductase-like flavin-dependent oxidoreductase (luciferase family)